MFRFLNNKFVLINDFFFYHFKVKSEEIYHMTDHLSTKRLDYLKCELVPLLHNSRIALLLRKFFAHLSLLSILRILPPGFHNSRTRQELRQGQRWIPN